MIRQLKKWIYSFLQKPHRCRYKKPIVSRYVSFNTRDIIGECECGDREVFRVYMPFERPFPIETTHFITDKDFNLHLNKENINDKQ